MQLTSRIIATISIAGATMLAPATPAWAQPQPHDITARRWVVSAGADVGPAFGTVVERADREVATLLGGFVRMGYERDPRFLDVMPGTFKAFVSLTPELSAARWSIDELDAINLVLGGVRADLMFKQERMGLLKVSGAGGLWLAARYGFAKLDGAHASYEFDFGGHLALGRTGMRLMYEFGFHGINQPDVDGFRAVVLRLGFGFYR